MTYSNPQFTIIIPAFNAEITIERCLNSLAAQSFPNFEALVIDNGSTDRTRDLIKSIVEQDSRFHYFWKPQSSSGPSAPRNLGLNNAAGEYIAFIDSDDAVMPDYLEKLKIAFESGAEAVFFGYSEINLDGGEGSIHIPDVSGDQYLGKLVLLSKQNLFGYTWIKAFKRNIIGENHFDEKLSLFEDEVFTCKICGQCHSIAVIPESLYKFSVGNPASLMSRVHPEYCQAREQVYTAWCDLLKNTEWASYLQELAEHSLNTCMYYGFERNVNDKTFFESLLNCTFWKDCQTKTPFLDALENHDIKAILKQKKVYQLKQKLHRLLKK